jgi:hypothetical protein
MEILFDRKSALAGEVLGGEPALQLLVRLPVMMHTSICH